MPFQQQQQKKKLWDYFIYFREDDGVNSISIWETTALYITRQ